MAALPQDLIGLGSIVSLLNSNSSYLDLGERLALYLNLCDVNHSREFYRMMAGAQLAKQVYETVVDKSAETRDVNEVHREAAIQAIAQFIKDNPRHKESELQAEIQKQIEIFTQKIQ